MAGAGGKSGHPPRERVTACGCAWLAWPRSRAAAGGCPVGCCLGCRYPFVALFGRLHAVDGAAAGGGGGALSNSLGRRCLVASTSTSGSGSRCRSRRPASWWPRRSWPCPSSCSPSRLRSAADTRSKTRRVPSAAAAVMCSGASRCGHHAWPGGRCRAAGPAPWASSVHITFPAIPRPTQTIRSPLPCQRDQPLLGTGAQPRAIASPSACSWLCATVPRQAPTCRGRAPRLPRHLHARDFHPRRACHVKAAKTSAFSPERRGKAPCSVPCRPLPHRDGTHRARR